MVCLGNICRSPLAEGIMQHLAKKHKLNWVIDSAGTGNWHIGSGPDNRSTLTAKNRGIDISKQVCRQFTIQDFDDFDLILVMDKNNLKDVKSLARNQTDREKIELFLTDQEVPDPYYDDNHFEAVFDLIEQGCYAFIKKHQQV